MDKAQTDALYKRYSWQTIMLCAALYLLGLLLMSVTWRQSLQTPLIVSAVYALVFEKTEIVLWRRVTLKAPDSLPTFFMAVSGFRFLSALLVMLVYYLACGRETMLTFVLVFAVFYVAMLVHHVCFFWHRKQPTA